MGIGWLDAYFKLPGPVPKFDRFKDLEYYLTVTMISMGMLLPGAWLLHTPERKRYKSLLALVGNER